MSNLREDPQQLSMLDAIADAAGEDVAEYDYRVDKHGVFIVTGTVPGYGPVTTRSRFLYAAVSEFRARAAAARAAVQPLF
ncbi:MAG TPA: hypothetical protein VGJ60_11300 [Chloroflexota bacterium]|jgi:hypothetical protein